MAGIELGRRRRSLLFGCCLLVCARAGAADEAIATITLPEALDYARAHRPLIREMVAALAARQEDARVPRARWLPQIGATAQLVIGTDNESTSTYLGVAEAPIARVGATKANAPIWTPAATTLVALTARQETYDFGRIAAEAALTDALVDETRANAQAAQLDVELAVEETYASVLAAEQILTATEDALKHAVTHRDFAAAGVERELRPQIDLSRAQAEVSAIEARRIRARGGVDAARAALAAAIGSSAGELEAAPLSLAELPSPSLAAALRAAAERNPAVVAALAHVRAQKAATRAIAHELLPNLFVALGLAGAAGGALSSAGTQPYGDGWLPDQQNWYAGLVLSWNVFDGAVWARRSAARVRESQAAAERDETVLAVSLATRQAWIDLQVAREALPSLRQTVDSARLNLRQAEARFRAELGNIIELSDAESTLINAELELAVGGFAVARGRAALGRALGDAAFGTGAP